MIGRMRKGASPDDRATPHTRSGHECPRVLCLEGNRAVAPIVNLFLEGAGYDVFLAKNVDEAWDVLRSAGADVLLASHGQPPHNALGFVTDIRDAGLDVPVVVMCGSLVALTDDDLKQYAPAAVLLRPFSRQQLLDALEKALRPASNKRAY